MRAASASLFVVVAALGCTPEPRQVSRSGAGAFEAALTGFPDGLAVAWYDTRDGNAEIYLATAAAHVQPDAVTSARRVTFTAGQSIGAYIAWNGPRIGVAWSDNTEGQHEISFQEFDAAGRERNAARQVTRTAAESLIPAIRPWGAGFVLAWNEHVPGAAGGQSGTSEIAAALRPESRGRSHAY